MLPPDSSTPDPGYPANPPVEAGPNSLASDPSDLVGGSIPPMPTVPVVGPAVGGSSSVRGPILALAMIVVAVLAGGALFDSGYLVGARSADHPGTPVSSE